MQGVLDGSYKPDAIFSSYDQMNSVKSQETQRRQFLDVIAPRAFVIMDESHNAGGQGPDSGARAAKGPAAALGEVPAVGLQGQVGHVFVRHLREESAGDGPLQPH